MTASPLPRRTAALAALMTASLLAGCALTPPAPARAVYDLGPSAAAATPGSAPAWRIADVTSPPWLASDGIAYRLAFVQPLRQDRYRDSVWAAPPAALLTQRLRERLGTPAGCGGRPAALLSANLDAFEQVFASATDSHVVLRLQATLWPAGATSPAWQQHWRIERPAPTPDAAGAARGLADAVDELVPQLATWLATAACR